MSKYETTVSATTARLLVRLRRLWKGTLYIAVASIYVGLVSVSFFGLNWQASLLTLGLIALSQIFRFVADEVDRIGWVLQSEDVESASMQASRYRRWLLLLLVVLIQLPNLALIWFIYESSFVSDAILFLILILFAEVLFLEVRRVNRVIAFREPSYGRNFGILQGGSKESDPVEPGRDEDLESRLRVLEKLASDGRISHQAYEKARDKYWVRRVMGDKG